MCYYVLVAVFLSISLQVRAAEDNVVNVYNWSDYIDKSILKDFEEETGIKVVYDVFDSNDVLETKLLAGGSGYDVVVPSASFLQRQIKAGAFQKLDKSKLNNYVNLWDTILKRTAIYDPGNTYSVNYLWGTTGLGINQAKILERVPDAPLNSWSLIFDKKIASKLAGCGIYLLDAVDEIVPAALNYLGLDPTDQSARNLRKAEPLLKSIRPYIKKFHSSEYINALANGDICLAIGWSGDILQARDRASEAGNGVVVEYVIPKEGALMWFDQMAIPEDAKHPENAHKFINYMMKPEIIARASNYVYFANGNITSQQYLSEDVIDDVAIYPDEKTLENLYVVEAYGAVPQRVLTRSWTRIKTRR